MIGAHEGLDHPHACQVLLQNVVESVQLLLHAQEEGSRLGDEEPHERCHHRYQNQHYGRELWSGPE